VSTIGELVDAETAAALLIARGWHESPAAKRAAVRAAALQPPRPHRSRRPVRRGRRRSRARQEQNGHAI
jgi:hypothetical protein